MCYTPRSPSAFFAQTVNQHEPTCPSKQQPSGKVQLVKNQYIDLGVFNGSNQLIELYDVKTNAERQTLYTAIGQIIVHRAGNAPIASFIVLPAGLQVPPDVGKALKTMAITVLRFAIKGDDVFIMG